jgi:hypothetical protein
VSEPQEHEQERMRFRLHGTVHDRPFPVTTYAPAAAYVEHAVMRSERKQLLERAARLRPRGATLPGITGVTGRNA